MPLTIILLVLWALPPHCLSQGDPICTSINYSAQYNWENDAEWHPVDHVTAPKLVLIGDSMEMMCSDGWSNVQMSWSNYKKAKKKDAAIKKQMCPKTRRHY